MAHGYLVFDCARSSAIAATMMVMASAADAQTTNPQQQMRSTDAPSASMHPVADNKDKSRGDKGGPAAFADLAEKVEPAVIGVSSKAAAMRRTLPDQSLGEPPDRGLPKNAVPMPGPPGQGRAPKTLEMMTIGSGFFISPDGYAVTNSHVVEDSDTAEIRTVDSKTYTAKVVGRDSLSDLALIKVDGRNDFTYVKLSDHPPRVGDWVLTAGNSFGLGATVTAGIVSARERDLGTGSDGDFVQIDAPINNGDSGGPSFNDRGDVIGVNSMIYSPSGGSVGVAFAIPADTVKAVIPQLKEKGTVTRGWIGAEVQSVTPDLAEGLEMKDARGAIVASVQNNAPAAKAGLRGGDVITSVNGEPVKNAGELTRKIHAMAPGTSVRLAMLRKGKEGSLGVTLGELPNQARNPPSGLPSVPR